MKDVLLKYQKSILLVVFLTPFLGIGFNTKADTPNYYITPAFSEHQTKEVTTFFDVRWTPNKSDKIGITITNKSDEDKNFEIKVNKARTNSNGVVNYTDHSKESSNSEQPTITAMVNFPDSVIVPAYKSETVYSTISFPGNDFNGIKMAGLAIREKDSKNENVVSYALPLIIRGNIDQRPIPKITFGKFNLKQNNFHSFALNLPISNGEATLLKGAEVQVKIINSNNSTVWKKSNKFLITPETFFTYKQTINKKLNAGSYRIQLVVKHADKTWKSTQDLIVSAQTAKKINQSMTNISFVSYLKKQSIIALIIIVIILILTLFMVTKKWKRRS